MAERVFFRLFRRRAVHPGMKAAPPEAFRPLIHGVVPPLTPESATRLVYWSAALVVVVVPGSLFVELDEGISAAARLHPSGQIHHIQHYEGGTIRDVLVREGDVVNRGTVLVRLVNPEGAKDLAERQARWTALTAALIRLSADLEQEETIFWPADSGLDEAVRRREETVHTERLALHAEQVTLHIHEISRRRQEIGELETKVGRLKSALAKLAEELALKKDALASGFIGRGEIVRLEREQIMLQSDYETARESAARLRTQLAESETQLKELERRWRSDVLGEINQTETAIAALGATMAIASDREARSEVRSPVRGIVKMAAITSVGQVARPGETLLDIVPVEDTLVIEARVAPPGHRGGAGGVGGNGAPQRP